MWRKLLIDSLQRAALLLILSAVFALPQFKTTYAQDMTLPSGFVEDVVVRDLWLPSSFAIAPDGRIFIVEKAGVVRVWQNGQLLPEPFIDMQKEVNSALDRGMLGIAVHPQFPAQPYVYVAYVYEPPETKGMEPTGARVARVTRLEADANNLNRVRPGSGVVLLGKNSHFGTIGNPRQGETRPFSCMAGRDTPLNDCLPVEGIHHTVGGLIFGADGALYVSNGDGINSIFGNIRAQNLDSLAGKILRIDPLTGDGLPSNPFFDGNPKSNRSKVYLVGMRNPFRFNIHPQTGEVYVGDVGNDNWEEINIGRAGANFGWPCYEGMDQLTTNSICEPLLSGAVQHTTGTYIYPHINSQGSVIGGDFYRGRTFPAQYHNRFFFGEFNEGTIMYLDPAVNGQSPSRRFGGNMEGPVQIVSAPDGNLYVLLIKAGTLSRIRFSMQEDAHQQAANPPSPSTVSPALGEYASVAPPPPAAVQPVAVQPTAPSATVPPATEPPATVPSATEPSATVPPATVPPATEPSATVPPATVPQPSPAPALTDAVTSVTVQPATERDVTSPIYVSVLEPADGTRVRIGDSVSYRGWATNAEGQVITPENLQWTAFLHHNEHTHYDYHNGDGTEGRFTYLDHGDRMYLELCLTATDGDLSNTDCVNILAQEVTYIFDSVPSGQPLIYNAGRYTTPFRVVTYVNAERRISAPRSPLSGYTFTSWSNGGESRQTLRIGNTNQRLAALYTGPNAAATAVPTTMPTSFPTPLPTLSPTSLPIAPLASPTTFPTQIAPPPPLPAPGPAGGPTRIVDQIPPIAPVDQFPTPLPPVPTLPAPTLPATAAPVAAGNLFPPGAFRVIHPGPTHSDSRRAYFKWETSVAPAEGQAFEVIFWKSGQDPLTEGLGIIEPTTRNDFRINLETLDIAMGDLFEPGTYNWTVLLVNKSPYQRLQILSDTRIFTVIRR